MPTLAGGYQGFTFNPEPLVLFGQNIGGGLNFTASNAVAQVDQQSAAYSFISGVNSAAYSFLGNTLQSVQSSTGSAFSDIISGLTRIGLKEADAQGTAAKNLCSGFLGCLF